MWQNIVDIPHQFLDQWLLGLWLVFGIGYLIWTIWKNGVGKDAAITLAIVVVGVVVIYVVVPQLEQTKQKPDGTLEVVGLTIRGYGFMFLLGIIAGVAMALVRARQVGIHPDVILALAFWMFVFGIVGARMLYVIEYPDQFKSDSPVEWFVSVVNMTKGGLVVYGSVFGGLGAAIVYLKRHRLPILAVSDMIAPSLLAGLALGRVGCLLNGCCYGGLSDWPVAVEFPPGSPPYMAQLSRGELLGLRTERTDEDGWREVRSVDSDSWAAEHAIEKGDRIRVESVDPDFMRGVQDDEAYDRPFLVEVDGKPPRSRRLSDLPSKSLFVHPTQVYSAINAALLALFLWLLYPFRKNDGELIAVMLMIYPVSRFLLEWIRDDEGGIWNTPITNAQWVSILMLPLAVGLLFYIRSRRGGLALPKAASQKSD